MVLQLTTSIGKVSLHADLAQFIAHANVAYNSCKQLMTL